MEIEISKKTFIIIFGVIILCVICFIGGRFSRYRSISGSAGQLESGIVSARDTVDTIADKLNIANASGKSSEELGQLIIESVDELQRGLETAKLATEKSLQQLDDYERILQDNHEYFQQLSGESDGFFDMAIRDAELYEQLISSLRQTLSNNEQNSRE